MASRALKLTPPLLDAMASALAAALAGGGFDGGDFDGQDPNQFKRALRWVQDERTARETAARQRRISLAVERAASRR